MCWIVCLNMEYQLGTVHEHCIIADASPKLVEAPISSGAEEESLKGVGYLNGMGSLPQ